MKKNRIRFVMPSHSLTFNDIKKNGYDVRVNYYGNKMPFRLLRELHFRLPLPMKKVWYNKANTNFSGIIIVYENLIIPEYIKWLHDNNSEARIILFYENLSNTRNNPELIDNEWCEKWTADSNEAKKYNINLYSGGGYFEHWIVNKKTPDIDVFYIGKDKNRLEKLKNIKKMCDKYDISTYFYLVQDRGYKKNDKIHHPFLPYSEVLQIIGRSKAILHLVEGCQKGITMRIEESLIHKVKLITDDVSIKKYDFYNSNNIFVIGDDKWENLKTFLNTPFVEVESSFYENANFDDFVRTLVGGN